MLSSRYRLTAAAFAAVLLLPASAGAQYYYVPSPEPPPRGFNRMIVTDAPMPAETGRSYPYIASSQPAIVEMKPASRRARVMPREAKFAAHPRNKAKQAALIEELKLKKNSRIKKVTVDTTGTVGPVEAAVPQRNAANKRASVAQGERIIRAEAEVRILGNDQMSIRLYRRGTMPSASAQ